MANVSYKEVIGVCGVIGSGKSYVAKLIAAKRDYQHINADDLFKNKVLNNVSYRVALQNFLDIFEIPAFIDEKYNGRGIGKLLFSDSQKRLNFPALKALNKLNSTYISDALREEMFGMNDCIIEMTTLPNFEYLQHKLHASIMVMGDCFADDENNRDNHIRRVVSRDSINYEHVQNIKEYQLNILNNHIRDEKMFQLQNMNTEFPEEFDCSFEQSFKKDEEILAQFDEIIKSARALTHVGY